MRTTGHPRETHSDDSEPLYDTVRGCVFSDYDFFYSLGEFDYFTDIRECFPEEVLEKYKDDIVYVKSTETGKKISDWHKTKKAMRGWKKPAGIRIPVW